jgi:hypothetical protein
VYVTAEPWPGLPIRRGNRRNKAVDLADGTWPNLVGKFKPHDYRHSHATWLDAANLSKVIQMDRRGHALQGMDRVYMHVTRQMRERLCEVLEELWQDAPGERYKISPHSHVPLLDGLLRAYEKAQQTGGEPPAATVGPPKLTILPLDLTLAASSGPPADQRNRL